jgi:transcriptional regulator with XRE-family HTH domain
LRFGRAVRALRVRRRWRQKDLAEAAAISRQVVSKVERGRISQVQVKTLRMIVEALDARLDVAIRWSGADLDRLLDEAHIALVDRLVHLYRAAGWEVDVEVSFSEWGERGSIDVVARRPATGIVSVNEVKASVGDGQATVHGIDRKARLMPAIARKRGWACRSVARILVVEASSMNRRRIAEHDATFSAAFPVRGKDVAAWIRNPGERPVSGLLFLASATGGSARRARAGAQRVQRASRLS